MKRDYFKKEDIELFLNSDDWEIVLNKKINNYKVCTIFEKGKNSKKDITLLSLVIKNELTKLIVNKSFNFIDNIQKSIKKLELAGYNFSANDAISSDVIYFELNDQKVEGVIYLFETLKSKGLDLTTNKEKISSIFYYANNPRMFDYLTDNQLIKMNKICMDQLKMLQESEKIQIMTKEFKKRGVGIGMLDYLVSKDQLKKEKKEFDNDYTNIIKFIDNPKTTTEELKELFKTIEPDTDLISRYINKTNIPVHMFAQGHYIHLLELKPKELFGPKVFSIIEKLEKKLNIQYIDRSGDTAQEIYQKTSKKFNKTFNENITISYKSATKF